MSNKSKAQQYSDAVNVKKPPAPRFRKAYVTHEGTLYIDPMNLEPSEALQLRDWLTDTFDVPSTVKAIIIGSSMEKVKEDNWTKDIKSGFVGRTRDGRRAIYQSKRDHAPAYLWEVGGYTHKYEGLTTFNVHGIIESDWDIISPWEGDNK